jgi:hypothetical protein
MAYDKYIKEGGGFGQLEMDTHADTFVLGINFIVLEYSGRVCDVYLYSQEYDTVKDVPIVRGATAVQDQDTGEAHIMIMNEGRWCGNRMNHSLINPNQLRHFQIEVCDNPFDKRGMHITGPLTKLSIPLLSKGTIIDADSHAPSDQELQTCRHFLLTSPSNWNPSTISLGQVTSRDVTQDISDIHAVYELANRENLINSDSFHLSYISAVYCDYEFTQQAKQIAMISSIVVPPIKNFVSTKRHSDITAADLSHQWRIGIKQAQDTLDTTTQSFSRSSLLPISRRYRNDRMFYRKYLNHQFAADLYMGRTKSLHGNTCAYIFAHKSGFTQAYPQANKTKSSDSLRQFAIDWVMPRKLVVDCALE